MPMNDQTYKLKLKTVYQGQEWTDAVIHVSKYIHNATRILIKHGIDHEYIFEDLGGISHKPSKDADGVYYIRIKIDNPKDMLYTQLALEK